MVATGTSGLCHIPTSVSLARHRCHQDAEPAFFPGLPSCLLGLFILHGHRVSVTGRQEPSLGLSSGQCGQ